MESIKDEYHISFFKPTTEHARANRNMVVWLVIIWVIAIFGFHILLRVIEEPRPEPVYNEYVKVWDAVQQGDASTAELQVFAKSMVSVLGKLFIQPDEKAALNNALSWSVYQLADSTQKTSLKQAVASFQDAGAQATSVDDELYTVKKMELENMLRPVVGFDESDIRASLIVFELRAGQMNDFSKTSMDVIPGIMSKYLIHNQSVLTDIVFLGFPFHYFYTAVFLLILFIVLCIIYCKRTEKINLQYNMENYTKK